MKLVVWTTTTDFCKVEKLPAFFELVDYCCFNATLWLFPLALCLITNFLKKSRAAKCLKKRVLKKSPILDRSWKAFQWNWHQPTSKLCTKNDVPFSILLLPPPKNYCETKQEFHRRTKTEDLFMWQKHQFYNLIIHYYYVYYYYYIPTNVQECYYISEWNHCCKNQCSIEIHRILW